MSKIYTTKEGNYYKRMSALKGGQTDKQAGGFCLV